MESQELFRGYYEPPNMRDGLSYGFEEWWNISGVGNEAGYRQTFQAFLSGQLKTPEDAAKKLQEVTMAGVERAIAENAATWKTDTWK